MAAKDIEFGSDARSKMLKGVETLAKTVKVNICLGLSQVA